MKNLMIRNSFLLSMLMTPLMSGCSVTTSDNIKSSGIYASNEVTSSQGNTTCRTTLQVGGSTGTYIELNGADELTCNGTKMNKSNNVANQIWYEALVAGIPGGTYRIQLSRSGESMSAEARLPREITGLQVEGGTTHVIGQPLSVSWQKSDDQLDVASATLAARTQHQDQFHSASLIDGSPETGRATFSSADTTISKYNEQTKARDHVPGPYNTVITVSRARRGTLNGAWNGSSTAKQSVQTNVSLVE